MLFFKAKKAVLSFLVMAGLLVFVSCAKMNSGQDALSVSGEGSDSKGLFNNNLSLVFIKNIGINDTQTKFNSPVGLAVDSQNNYYVADSGNNLIKKFDAQGNLLKSWGGHGVMPGHFDFPAEITVDANDNLYVAELGNSRIQKFNSEGRFLQFIGVGVLNHVRSVAVAEDGIIYALDEFNCRVVKFDPQGNQLLSWGSFGFFPGQFNYPNSLSYRNGKIYVADTQNNRIQIFNQDGSLIASFGSYGNGDKNFYYPRGVFVDESENIYVSDSFNSRVMKYDAQFNLIGKIATPGVVITPNKVVVEKTGAILVSDPGVHLVKKFNSSLQFVSWIGNQRSGNGEFNYVTGITYAKKKIYTVDSYNHRIQVFSLQGEFLFQFGGFGFGAGKFFSPRGVNVNAAGEIYVVDQSNHIVQKFDANGNYLAAYGGKGNLPGQFYMPCDIQIDADGNFYVTDTGNNRVQKFDANFNFILSFGSLGYGNGQFYGPTRVAFDDAKNVYVTDYGNQRVAKFTSNGEFLLNFGGYGQEAGKLYYPSGILVKKNQVLVSESGNMRLSVFDTNGNFIKTIGKFGTGNFDFFFPTHIAAGPLGTVFISSCVLNKIQQFISY